jgi:hypothetical protein
MLKSVNAKRKCRNKAINKERNKYLLKDYSP